MLILKGFTPIYDILVLRNTPFFFWVDQFWCGLRQKMHNSNTYGHTGANFDKLPRLAVVARTVWLALHTGSEIVPIFSDCTSHYSQTGQLIKIRSGMAVGIRIAQLLAQTASKLVYPKKKGWYLGARTSKMGVKPFRINIGPIFFWQRSFLRGDDEKVIW